MNKYQITMRNRDGEVTKEIMAKDINTAISKADPSRKFKEYIVVLNGEQVLKRQRI